MQDLEPISKPTFESLKRAIQADFRVNGEENSTLIHFILFNRDPIVRFLVNLRILEYVFLRRNQIIFRLLSHLVSRNFKRLSYKTGFSIPLFTISPGVSLPHFGPIVINPKSYVGAGSRIHVGVNIGGTGEDVPRLGDNVYLGPGCKLFGKIFIHDGCKVGANAVVFKGSTQKNSTLVGIPAREILHST